MVSVLYCSDDIAVMMCKADRERIHTHEVVYRLWLVPCIAMMMCKKDREHSRHGDAYCRNECCPDHLCMLAALRHHHQRHRCCNCYSKYELNSSPGRPSM